MRIIKHDDIKVVTKHIVDEAPPVIIGNNIPQSERASKQETQRMLEETLDRTSNPEEKRVYEKIWQGTKNI